MKIKSNFISTLELRALHPNGVIADSDMYFASLANKIFRTLLNDKLIKRECDEYFLRQISLKSSSYLEDTVSQWGLFDGFRKLHSEICGKLMPFYNVDEEYYRDEINIEDVQFLVWSTFQEIINEKEEICFINPDNPMLMLMSSVIFDILDEEYEFAPENEKIYELLHKTDFDDFIDFRQLLEWLCLHTYLSTNNAKNTVERLKLSIRKNYKENKDYVKLFSYLVESNAYFYYACTPMSVKAIDWFRAITTNSRMLERIENVSCRPFQRYKIMGSDDSFINLESFGDEKIKIPLARESMNSLDPNRIRKFSMGEEIAQTNLVFFDGIWQVNGAIVFTEMSEKIQEEEDQKNEKKKRFEENVLYSYKKLFKYNKNKQIAFFKNGDELEEFWNKAFPDAKQFNDILRDYPYLNKSSLILFIYPKDGSFILPNIAECIKFPGNEFYNENNKDNEDLALLTGGTDTPIEFLEFIINNNCIPNAKINSLISEERGRSIVQDNKWFIVRFFQSNLFDESIIENSQFEYMYD